MGDAPVVPIRSELRTVPPGPREVESSQTLAQAALAVLTKQVDVLFDLEREIIDGEVDAVHDARVAIRRTRTAMRIFRDALPERAQALRSELGWLGTQLGFVRDVDVMRQRIAAFTDDGSAEERAALEAVDMRLASRRTTAHHSVMEALMSHRYAALRYGLLHVLHGGGSRGVAAGSPVLEAAPRLIRKRHRAMRRAGKGLGVDAEQAALHRLRIRTKRLRYTIEFFAPLYGKRSRPLLKRVRAQQDLLGDLRDAEVAVDALRSIAAGADGGLDGSSRFVLGRIAERQRATAGRLRCRFPETIDRIRGRRWKDLKRRMRTAV